ncbi:MAG: hypothetical protein KDB27_09935 [Planctomycetales bacterium]|nr:hypothetical protein [Planctomycetales bacterium]
MTATLFTALAILGAHGRIQAEGPVANVTGDGCFEFLGQPYTIDLLHYKDRSLRVIGTTHLKDQVLWDYLYLSGASISEDEFWWGNTHLTGTRGSIDAKLGDGRRCDVTVESWTTFDHTDLVVGDVSGDGVFNSHDLVEMFIAGEYEDRIAKNSKWTEGDFTFDLEFSSDDLVVMFRESRYADAANVANVPEPGCSGLLILSIAIASWLRRAANTLS